LRVPRQKALTSAAFVELAVRKRRFFTALPVAIAINPYEIRGKLLLTLKMCDFPQFFPQLWKTLGTDQTTMTSFGE